MIFVYPIFETPNTWSPVCFSFSNLELIRKGQARSQSQDKLLRFDGLKVICKEVYVTFSSAVVFDSVQHFYAAT